MNWLKKLLQETQLKESGQHRVMHKNLDSSVMNVCDKKL
jgi:hypothetical protein